MDGVSGAVIAETTLRIGLTPTVDLLHRRMAVANNPMVAVMTWLHYKTVLRRVLYCRPAIPQGIPTQVRCTMRCASEGPAH
jgi:hypothetical protein